MKSNMADFDKIPRKNSLTKNTQTWTLAGSVVTDYGQSQSNSKGSPTSNWPPEDSVKKIEIKVLKYMFIVRGGG